MRIPLRLAPWHGSGNRRTSMRYIHSIPAAAKASAILGLGLLALGFLAGCSGDGPTAPERTWEEVRYHWSAGQSGESYGDLVVRSSGEMVWNLQGERAPESGPPGGWEPGDAHLPYRRPPPCGIPRPPRLRSGLLRHRHDRRCAEVLQRGRVRRRRRRRRCAPSRRISTPSSSRRRATGRPSFRCAFSRAESQSRVGVGGPSRGSQSRPAPVDDRTAWEATDPR